MLLERAGYVAFRRFATMRRPDLGDLPRCRFRTGSRSARSSGIGRRCARSSTPTSRRSATTSAGARSSDEKFEEFVGTTTDPALWLVAFDGDEVAGAVLNGIHVDADGARSGWLDSIFTRRPWRRRGLARALIARSLVLLRDRGLTAA